MAVSAGDLFGDGYASTVNNTDKLFVRGRGDAMVPLSSLMNVDPTFGPTRVTRYNGFPSADINGAGTNPGDIIILYEGDGTTALARGYRLDQPRVTAERRTPDGGR